MQWTVEQALEHWQSEGLITKQKADALRASLDRSDAHLPHRAIQMFAGVGAVLVGLGIILFVASNWSEMTPLFKVVVLLLGMLGTGGVGYGLLERGTYPRTGQALLLVHMFAYGASIFLVAQIYHLPLNFWLGTFLWMLGAVFFAVVLRSRWHLSVGIVLLLATIGWFRSALLSGASDEFGALFDPRTGATTLLLLFGFLLICGGILARSRKQMGFGTDTLVHWGLFFLLLPLVISTADRAVFFPMFWLRGDPVTTGMIILVLVAVPCVWAKATFATTNGKQALLALLAYIAFIYALVRLPQIVGFPSEVSPFGYGGYQHADAAVFTGLFVLHILLVCVFLLVTVWFGTLLKLPAAVNLGMLGIAFVIFIQYFSWAFALLDRSVAFILGGLLILALSSALERKRRHLLRSIRT